MQGLVMAMRNPTGDRQRWSVVAAEAAAALVASMTTTLWPAAKARITLLLGADDPARGRVVGTRLEESRAAIAAAPDDPAVRERAAAQWTAALVSFADGDDSAGMWMRHFTDTFTHLPSSPHATNSPGDPRQGPPPAAPSQTAFTRRD